MVTLAVSDVFASDIRQLLPITFSRCRQRLFLCEVYRKDWMLGSAEAIKNFLE